MADLITVQVKGNVGTIEDNLDKVAVSIHQKAAEYSAIVVTEDSVKDGKQLLADIRKEKAALDNERKEIKKQWMAPYEAFEKKVKAIIALYDEPIGIINAQLSEFEQRRVAEKREEIQSIYNFVKNDLEEWLPLGRIYNPKWENVTYTSKKIREDMEQIFHQMDASITTVKSMNSEFEADALRVLKETGSLQEAIAEINTLQRQKERFLEQAQQEAERERLEKERREAEEKTEPEQTNQEIPQELPTVPAPVKEEPLPDLPFAAEKQLRVIVEIGENDFECLKSFFEEYDISYTVQEMR